MPAFSVQAQAAPAVPTVATVPTVPTSPAPIPTATPTPKPPELTFSKSADVEVVMSDTFTITYSLRYTNTGDAVLKNVVLIEKVPDYTTYKAAGSTPGWDCPDNSGPGVVCRFLVGTLLPGQAGVALFVVRINHPLPADLGAIVNVADVEADSDGGTVIIIKKDGGVKDVIVARPTGLEVDEEPTGPPIYRLLLAFIQR
ncbi:MAG: hypothetical protein M3Q45_05850 [Chloroflexota bacterium]|nr:hypothetical protein [Chloroflexota bacterium]